jgi:hypothetical protein
MIMRRACRINEEINSRINTLTEGIAAPSVFSPQWANPRKRHWIEGSICRGNAELPACASSADVRLGGGGGLVRLHWRETIGLSTWLLLDRDYSWVPLRFYIRHPKLASRRPNASCSFVWPKLVFFVLIDFSCQHAKFKRCHIKFQISDFS